MAYRNNKHHHGKNLHHHHHQHDYAEYGYQEYQNEGVEEAGVRRLFESPGQYQRGRGAFKSNMKADAFAEVKGYDLAETERSLERLRERDENNNYEDVNQEAEAFIELEHRRMDLTGLMSMRAV